MQQTVAVERKLIFMRWLGLQQTYTGCRLQISFAGIDDENTEVTLRHCMRTIDIGKSCFAQVGG